MGRRTFAIGLFWHPLKQESDASIAPKQRCAIDDGDRRVAPLCQRVGFLPLVGRGGNRVWRTWAVRRFRLRPNSARVVCLGKPGTDGGSDSDRVLLVANSSIRSDRGNGAEVDGDGLTVVAWAGLADGTGERLFATTELTRDQDRDGS